MCGGLESIHRCFKLLSCAIGWLVVPVTKMGKFEE